MKQPRQSLPDRSTASRGPGALGHERPFAPPRRETAPREAPAAPGLSLRQPLSIFSPPPVALPRTSAQAGVIQRSLNEGNLAEYYSVTLVKSGVDKVYVGTLKGPVAGKNYPPRIVYKKGAGAGKDRDANLKLMGQPGIYDVLGAGQDYLIRAAYDESDTYTTWEPLAAKGSGLIKQTVSLAIHLLDKGIIDVDRGVEPSPDGSVHLTNMVITGKGQAKPSVHFFDFEPRYTIDWRRVSFEDKEKYESWLRCYRKIVRNLASNVGINPEAAVNELEDMGGRILKKYNAVTAFEEEPEPEHGGYQPPVFAELDAKPKVMPPAEKLDPAEREYRGRIAEALYYKAEKYYDSTNNKKRFEEVCAALDDWCRGLGKAPFMLMAEWKKEVGAKAI